VTSTAEAALTRWVRADRSKLTQALLNVLANAYKYSPKGGAVELEVLDAPATEDQPVRIGLRVVDHGIGMSPEQVARVCERFYRADASGSIPGTGLGMSIVKEIVGLHGGEVEIASQMGTGTTVTLWIPGRVEPVGEA
jgi:signal transduction histidine kinase